MHSIARSRLARVAAALAAAFTFLHTAPALAQGGRLAAECIHEMHDTARHTSASVHAIAARGAQLIGAIDDQGATDEQLIEAARNTNQTIQRRAAAGADRINGLADRCVQRLGDIGADEQLITRVIQARRILLGSVADAAVESAEFVRAALRRALND